MFRRKGNVEAVQYEFGESAKVLELGGDLVHMGPTAEPGVTHPHLSTEAGNTCICEGDWLVKDGDQFSVMSDEAFKSVYEAA